MKPELELIRSGIVTPEQYVEALERQASETPPLGQIAIEEGTLSARDVFEILHTQRLSPNRRFGDVAIELGHLTRSDVALLLLEQLERRRPVIEHLFELDAITSDQAFGVPTDTHAQEAVLNEALAMA